MEQDNLNITSSDLESLVDIFEHAENYSNILAAAIEKSPPHLQAFQDMFNDHAHTQAQYYAETFENIHEDTATILNMAEQEPDPDKSNSLYAKGIINHIQSIDAYIGLLAGNNTAHIIFSLPQMKGMLPEALQTDSTRTLCKKIDAPNFVQLIDASAVKLH